jgi:hypothetical protein
MSDSALVAKIAKANTATAAARSSTWRSPFRSSLHASGSASGAPPSATSASA